MKQMLMITKYITQSTRIHMQMHANPHSTYNVPWYI